MKHSWNFGGGAYPHLAFTLAEVLITLGIIGVVAALTMPTLTKNYQKKVYVTQLIKTCNEIEQAFEKYISDKNAINLREARLNNSTRGEFLNKYFHVVKDCGSSVSSCFASQPYLNMSLPQEIDFSIWDGMGYYAVTLANGASLYLNVTDFEEYYAFIGVDVNGQEGPNIFCRDFFGMMINQDGTIQVDEDSCVGYVIQNRVMDDEYDRTFGLAQ